MVREANLHLWRSVACAVLLASSVVRAADESPRVYRVGFVAAQSPSTAPNGVTAFRDRLRELGYMQGENLVIEARWSGNSYDRLPALVDEPIARKVDILLVAATPAALAAMNATKSIPIVGFGLADPLRSGLATNLARPDKNLTGFSMGWTEGAAGKWLELLQDTVPRLSAVAVLANPENSLVRELVKEIQTIAPTRGVKVRVIEVREPGALDKAFAKARRHAQAMIVLPDPIMAANRGRIANLAANARLPAVYYLRDFVEAGGLMAYGPELSVMSRRAADYVDRILKGAKPSDLPIEEPTGYLLAVNLSAAEGLKLKIPEAVMTRASEIVR